MDAKKLRMYEFTPLLTLPHHNSPMIQSHQHILKSSMADRLLAYRGKCYAILSPHSFQYNMDETWTKEITDYVTS